MSVFPKGYLLLMGDFDPDEISHQLGIEASICTRAGELNRAAGTPRDGGSWLLEASPFPGSGEGDVADQVISLLGQLEGKQGAFAALAQQYRGSMNVFALVDGEKESFFLGEGLALAIGNLNVNFECWFVRKSELGQVAAVSA